jgi:phosphoribosylformylglycinamidine cyclo-ligase
VTDEGLTYQQSGVDIEAAQTSLREALPHIRQTYTEQVIQGVGAFGSLFRADFCAMEMPVLVSSIDGVGTKTKIAQMTGDFSGIGRDLVNHSVNDILCQGARPLFFLDYFGCSQLSGDSFVEVVKGIAEACRDLNFALIGGETAELPGVFNDDEFDVVGSIVGVVDEPKMLPKPAIPYGSALIGLASSGLHTNGFSLARRALFDVGGLSLDQKLEETGLSLAQALLEPHRCYFHPVYEMLQNGAPIYAIAHITGGGIGDNLERVLPKNCRAIVEKDSWTAPEVFRVIQSAGQIDEQEMFRVFNMGIGMILVVDKDCSGQLLEILNESGCPAAVIGEIQTGSTDVQLV